MCLLKRSPFIDLEKLYERVKRGVLAGIRHENVSIICRVNSVFRQGCGMSSRVFNIDTD